MITFDETTKIIKLDTPDSSYVMGIADNNYLGHVYYGKKLNDTNLSYLMRTEETGRAPLWFPAMGRRERNCPM